MISQREKSFRSGCVHHRVCKLLMRQGVSWHNKGGRSSTMDGGTGMRNHRPVLLCALVP